MYTLQRAPTIGPPNAEIIVMRHTDPLLLLGKREMILVARPKHSCRPEREYVNAATL